MEGVLTKSNLDELHIRYRSAADAMAELKDDEKVTVGDTQLTGRQLKQVMLFTERIIELNRKYHDNGVFAILDSITLTGGESVQFHAAYHLVGLYKVDGAKGLKRLELLKGALEGTYDVFQTAGLVPPFMTWLSSLYMRVCRYLKEKLKK